MSSHGLSSPSAVSDEADSQRTLTSEELIELQDIAAELKRQLARLDSLKQGQNAAHLSYAIDMIEATVGRSRS